ncbi:hypothetical protein VTH8203_04508 [Vibrio thalassae]|uniref:Uncharacterized protein n=1 Tax=Vibrio thalassae TaxID=1243014 RepID=A0A240EQE1_9VIBR|nr:hypothetical protein [Vibrio thalassae]SNX50834.1 hypothetical protein VTH8203_04508 [Vibrio thalassae]
MKMAMTLSSKEISTMSVDNVIHSASEIKDLLNSDYDAACDALSDFAGRNGLNFICDEEEIIALQRIWLDFSAFSNRTEDKFNIDRYPIKRRQFDDDQASEFHESTTLVNYYEYNYTFFDIKQFAQLFESITIHDVDSVDVNGMLQSLIDDANATLAYWSYDLRLTRTGLKINFDFG